MTDAERVAASTDTGDLHWIGPNVVAAGAVLSSGRHPSGHVEMYAPGSQQPGSSVSHFSTSLFPNQLMEPSYTGPTYDVGLAGPLMEDIGWMFAPDLVVSTITVSNDTLTTGQPFTIRATVENTGGGSSDSTTLRYFRSTDATISTADTQLGTDAVTGLSPGGASIESILATAPGTQGIYWIGACVDAISGESSTSNNCSSGVRITVSSFSGLKQLKEEFETWPPEGWSVINNGGTCVWESNSTTGAQNYAQGTGFCADANSDWCGENSTMETELRTPVLDLTEIVRARLSFISSYNNFSENGYAHVDISTNGGDTWENLLKWQEDHYANTQSETVRINLKQYVGYSEVVIRFHYNAPDGFGWWQIDDVVIQSSGRKAMPWIPLLLLNNDNG
jgi:hypothetical protein